MARTAIATDSNSGITQSQAKELGVFVLPMPFFMRGKIQFEDIDLTQEQFYEILAEDAAVSTSQPSPGDLMDFWNKILEEYDDIVYIPMSSGLSASCDTATVLSEDYEGKVQDALDASIYIMVDTLKYLKKGGRVTPAAAMIGTVLNIKPVLTIQGEKLDAFEKARGVKQAKKAMIKAMKKDMDKRFAKERTAGIMGLHIAYTANDKEVIDGWIVEGKEAFPDFEVDAHPLSLSVACHIGPGALAIACEKKSAIS